MIEVEFYIGNWCNYALIKSFFPTLLVLQWLLAKIWQSSIATFLHNLHTTPQTSCRSPHTPCKNMAIVDCHILAQFTRNLPDVLSISSHSLQQYGNRRLPHSCTIYKEPPRHLVGLLTLLARIWQSTIATFLHNLLITLQMSCWSPHIPAQFTPNMCWQCHHTPCKVATKGELCRSSAQECQELKQPNPTSDPSSLAIQEPRILANPKAQEPRSLGP